MGTSLDGALQPLLPVPTVDEEPKASPGWPGEQGHATMSFHPTSPPHTFAQETNQARTDGPSQGQEWDGSVPIPASAGFCKTGIREEVERMSPA